MRGAIVSVEQEIERAHKRMQLTLPTSFKLFLFFLLLLVSVSYGLNQVRKPDRWLGRFVLWTMNLSHSDLTDWGLTRIRIDERFTILDVGCGGGRTVQKLAGIATQGMVYGVDFANGSVAASRAKNAELIQAGLVEIRQASVSQLPFSDNYFDLVTAVETHYYWPDLVRDMQEILRVLKPGGTLIFVVESYNHSKKPDRLQWREMGLLNFRQLSVDEHRETFLSSGYTAVQIVEKPEKGWICVIGSKPL